jgi:hypothetical protein
VDLKVELALGLLKLDLKEVKFLVLLRTPTAVGEPKAPKKSSMEVSSQVSLSGLRSFGIGHDPPPGVGKAQCRVADIHLISG